MFLGLGFGFALYFFFNMSTQCFTLLCLLYRHTSLTALPFIPYHSLVRRTFSHVLPFLCTNGSLHGDSRRDRRYFIRRRCHRGSCNPALISCGAVCVNRLLGLIGNSLQSPELLRVANRMRIKVDLHGAR